MRTTSAVWLVLFAALAGGQEDRSRIDDLPSETTGVEVEEKLGAMLPMGASFRDETGKLVTLGDCFKEKKTTILTLNYFECPKLCQVQLEALVTGMRKLALDLGKDYQVVTVDIDPREDWKRAAVAEKKFLGMYERPLDGRRGWWFLTSANGKEPEIERVAGAVGFGYKWLPKQKQYSHQPAVIVVSPEGKICRYIYGVEFKPETLRMTLVEASQGKIGSPIERFAIMYCYEYDPTIGSYKFQAIRAMQLGAVGVMTVLAMGLAYYWRKEILAWKCAGRPKPAA